MTARLAAEPRADDAARQLHCPLCDYNLHGLDHPRCPECGYAAESWQEMHRRSTETHRFLFEHHPEQNLWSRARTWFAGLHPWRFWQSLRPEHRVRPGRLVRYWLAFALLVILPVAVMLMHAGMAMHLQRQRDVARFVAFLSSNHPSAVERQERLIVRFGSIEAAVDSLFPPPLTRAHFRRLLVEAPAVRLLVPFVIMACLWPWLVVPAMSCFALTLRRARIRPVQLLRCAVYSWDVVVLPAALFLLATLWMLLPAVPAAGPPGWAPPPWYHWQLTVAEWFLPVVLVLALLVALRLGVAFGHYLHLRHAFMTALLVQVVLALAGAKLMYLVWGY